MLLTNRALAALVCLAGAGAMAACTADAPAPSGEETSAEGSATEGGSGGKVTIAETNAFSSFNPATSKGNVDINGKINYATTATFYRVTPELKVQHNDDVGTFEKISDDPLTVKYTVNESIKWSDGNPMDAGDLLLSWAYQSGYYDDFKKGEGEDDKGTGTTYFDYAGSTDGLGLTALPEISDDGRTITLVYSKPFADWEIKYDLPPVPAHVIAKKAGLADEAELVKLFQDTPKGDPEAPKENEKLKKVGEVFNTAFDTKSLPSEKDMYLASGPFIVSDIQADQSLTMVRNEEYGGEKAKLDEVTVRYIGDPVAAIQALRNGEADIIDPQPSADTMKQLQALESQGVKTIKGLQAAYDHIDLNFSGVFEDPKVRQAFMHCVPRKDIVAKVVGELDPEAKPLDSQMFTADNDAYANSAANNGSEAYAEVNVDKAKELLGDKKPEVRIMYFKDNPNRSDTFNLIRQKCSEAGFNIVDAGTGKGWGGKLGDGTYDAVIFGWISAGVGNEMVPQIFKGGGGGNFNGFDNAEVNAKSDELISTIDAAKQTEIITDIDKLVWEDFYGLPLFQAIGVTATTEGVKGVQFQPNQRGVWWNIDDISNDA